MTTSTDTLEALSGSVEQVRDYQTQLDAHGTMVGVSRQALEDVLAAVNALPDHIAEIKRLREALEQCDRLIKEALPKFNWGASALDANAIRLLNETPLAIREALEPRT